MQKISPHRTLKHNLYPRDVSHSVDIYVLRGDKNKAEPRQNRSGLRHCIEMVNIHHKVVSAKFIISLINTW